MRWIYFHFNTAFSKDIGGYKSTGTAHWRNKNSLWKCFISVLSILQPERTGIKTLQIFGFVYSLECIMLKSKLKLRAVPQWPLFFFLTTIWYLWQWNNTRKYKYILADFSVVSSYKVESSCAPKSEKVDLFVYVLICIFIILNTFINLIFSFEPSLLLLYFDNK